MPAIDGRALSCICRSFKPGKSSVATLISIDDKQIFEVFREFATLGLSVLIIEI